MAICIAVLSATMAMTMPSSSTSSEDAPRRISLDMLGQDTRVGDPSCLERFQENLRLTLDLSTRVIHNTDTDDSMYAQFIGIDLHKVFTGDDGDWGTLVLQPYLTRLDGFGAPPPFFEGGDDWELVYRIFNFNYTGFGRGRPNIRVGHMEIPFGLEHVVNTNGTLRDYIHGRNIGVKADWGVSVNGASSNVEYEVALTRGSGNEYSETGNPHVLAGRVGTLRSEPFAIGVSAMHGEIQRLAMPDKTLRRKRVGVDAIWTHESVTLLGEVSFGDDEGTDVLNVIAEIDWSNADETWLLYNQIEYFSMNAPAGWDDNIVNILGVRWAPDRHWALSAQWSQDLTTFGAVPRKGLVALQLRYRF